MRDGMVLFEVEGRQVDGWGNDHGEVTPTEVPAPPTPREVLSEATSANASGGPQFADDEALEGMSGDQLKSELKLRKDSGRELDTAGITRVGDLRNALKADNKKISEE